MTAILTHRGLEPDRSDFFRESSAEAFRDQLGRGFGLEFDPAFLCDGRIAVVHDATLKRITGGADSRAIKDLSSADLMKVSIKGGNWIFLDELLLDIKESSASVHALHFKGGYQSEENCGRLAATLKANSKYLDKVIVFDVTLATALKLKTLLPDIKLAPSVAHPFDIKRYNSAVHGTLLSIEQAIAHRDIFDWVWLDEWDRSDKGGEQKTLYNPKTFELLRSCGMQIALVTPELHGSSPGLLGSEAHPDARNRELLKRRFQEILMLRPDAVCSDYPEEIEDLLRV